MNGLVLAGLILAAKPVKSEHYEMQVKFSVPAKNLAACLATELYYRPLSIRSEGRKVSKWEFDEKLSERSASFFRLDFFGSFCVKTKRTLKIVDGSYLNDNSLYESEFTELKKYSDIGLIRPLNYRSE